MSVHETCRVGGSKLAILVAAIRGAAEGTARAVVTWLIVQLMSK